MRIISKFRDYYDSVRGSGVDSERVWIRKTEPIEQQVIIPTSHYSAQRERGEEPWLSMARAAQKGVLQKMCQWTGSHVQGSQCYHGVNGLLLVIGGKTFPGIEVTHERLNKTEKGMALNWVVYDRQFMWNKADVQAWLDKEGVNPDQLNCESGISEKISERLKVFFDTEYDFINSAIEAKAPIVLCTTSSHGNVTYTANPNLSELGCVSCLDPWQAYQEIQMFVGGVLCSNENPKIELTDKERVVQHGFDDHSFRKSATKKKKKASVAKSR